MSNEGNSLSRTSKFSRLHNLNTKGRPNNGFKLESIVNNKNLNNPNNIFTDFYKREESRKKEKNETYNDYKEVMKVNKIKMETQQYEEGIADKLYIENKVSL